MLKPNANVRWELRSYKFQKAYIENIEGDSSHVHIFWTIYQYLFYELTILRFLLDLSPDDEYQNFYA